MHTIIPDLLWIGNAQDLRDVKAALALGIKAVIDLAANEPPVLYPRDIAYCRFPLNDGTENDPTILRLAVASTADFVKARVPTLVACSAGMSRSPALVAAAIAMTEDQSPDDVLRRIASTGPHDVAPLLWAEIKQVVRSSAVGSRCTLDRPSLTLLVLKTLQTANLLAFYRTIGIDLVEEQHGRGPLHHSAQLGNTVLELYPAQDAHAVNSATRLGFTLAHLAEVIETLRSASTPIVSEPKTTEWGTRAVVRDPEGRTVELYQQ
jgi:hypothetical protein